jgi:hypothetical protein
MTLGKTVHKFGMLTSTSHTQFTEYLIRIIGFQVRALPGAYQVPEPIGPA